jgi:hypothetical protein
MSPEEKDQLVALLLNAQCWCQGAEAHDAGGQAVAYSDADATAWDLTGAACHLFGWRRARELFVQIDRHLHGHDTAGADQSDSEIAAMVALQTWNDNAQTTHVELITRLQSLPVRPVAGSGPCLPAGDKVPQGTER